MPKNANNVYNLSSFNKIKHNLDNSYQNKTICNEKINLDSHYSNNSLKPSLQEFGINILNKSGFKNDEKMKRSS